jgi:hypothetical protein
VTSHERDTLAAIQPGSAERPIPWVFVGRRSKRRLRLLQQIRAALPPNGFVYMPRPGLIAENGLHLDGAQYQAVLRRARLQIWTSHHDAFYLESERFRNSALAGCLPIKVVSQDTSPPASVPFRGLLVLDSGLSEALSGLDYEHAWRCFAEEYAALPSLGAGLRQALPALADPLGASRAGQ